MKGIPLSNFLRLNVLLPCREIGVQHMEEEKG